MSEAQKKNNVEVFATAAELTRGAAERFAESARNAISSWGRFAVALSGGTTPQALYTLLAKEPFASQIKWTGVHLFWGDERCVPPDDAESNYRLVREALLDEIKIPPANVHRMRGEDPPVAAAAAYERELREAFGTATGPSRGSPGSRFDLVLLGLGGDGHTASLFPRMKAVREDSEWVMAENVASLGKWRLTLTPVIINDAGEVLFLVEGSAKATILNRVLNGARDPDEVPATAIVPASGRVRWMVDAAAAAKLPAA